MGFVFEFFFSHNINFKIVEIEAMNKTVQNNLNQITMETVTRQTRMDPITGIQIRILDHIPIHWKLTFHPGELLFSKWAVR